MLRADELPTEVGDDQPDEADGSDERDRTPSRIESPSWRPESSRTICRPIRAQPEIVCTTIWSPTSCVRDSWSGSISIGSWRKSLGTTEGISPGGS